jgi:phage recombination protein Bet
MEEKGMIAFEDPKIILTLKRTVAQGLTDEEFMLFAQFCKSTKLNPFKKEIWAIKAGGRLQLMTGIAGYLAIANSNPQFDGMEVDVTTDDKGKPVKATCKVYRKDRKYPSVGIALMSEFAKSTPIWSQMPSVMLQKVAKSIALREAFPQELNGLYTQEEMPQEYAAPTATVETKAELVEAPKPTYYEIPNITREQQLYIEKRGAVWDEEKGLWAAPKDLGEKLEKYKKHFGPKSETIEDDDIPDNWREEVNAKVEVPEKPLEKAQKKAKAIQQKLQEQGADASIDEIVERIL